MNECDNCNQALAKQYEDDLSKWFGPMRTVSQIKGKSGVPTYKNSDMRIDMGARDLEIGVVAEDLESHLKFDGPFTFTLPVPAKSQTFTPINAAKALVKIACSLCPPGLLGECKPAIDWLMGRARASMSMYPVLFAFTPGPMPYLCSGRVRAEAAVRRAVAAEPAAYSQRSWQGAVAICCSCSLVSQGLAMVSRRKSIRPRTPKSRTYWARSAE